MTYSSRTIVVVDVAGFTAPERTSLDRLAIRQGLYEVLKTAFAGSDVDFGECAVEDRGDGALILMPPGTEEAVVADRLPDRIAVALRRYNHTRTPQAWMRLRVSLNFGDVHHDGTGWGGEAIDTAFRILDAQATKEKFADTSLMAMISSRRFFDEVIARDPGLLPELYTPVEVSVKAFTETAYLRLHGEGSPPVTEQPGTPVAGGDLLAASTVETLAMFPVEDRTPLRHQLTMVDVPQLPVLMSRALGPSIPLPSLADVTDAWSAFLVLTDYNAGPDGIPPAITFLRLLAEQVGGELGSLIDAWVRDQARGLRLVSALERHSSAQPAPTFHLEFPSADLDDMLAYDGPDLAGLFESAPPDAPLLATQQHDPPGFPISIYLSTAAGHELVQAAVEGLVRMAGAEIIELGDPEIGSWMRRLVGRVKDAADTPAGREAAATVAHAADARFVQAQDAANTATLMQNLAPTLTALQHIPSAVVRVGALLIVKNGDTLAVHQLTAAQQFHLNHEPDLLASPHDILRALGLHATQDTAAVPATPPAPLRVTPPARPGGEPTNCVGPAWQRITAWLRTNTPATAATLRPPAPAADIRAVQHTMGLVLPDDLLEWWQLTDGVDGERDYRAAFTVPGVFLPLPVARVQETWAGLSAYQDESCCHADGGHRQPAGEPTAMFCSALIPICRALDGSVLAVDLRPGARRGHVMDWAAQAGAHCTTWPNVSALLSDTADRLENHDPTRPAQPGRPFIRDDGVLTWA
ncbi:hypothetical protein GCM10027598_74960 [Amycolatopsis oliviviridis]|uniref:Knr4/Smi1-like domain-containing protein n=1 Tax=Amycolatopsis oliviviridis TaxID=1471590 RepID=A0ABQ3LCX4_9PSEU|nr:SMI1/KNR4 family protein [Amycolatopsis oliviviridis]GHH03208.1 hypothetical protein GCM10017790_04900 [Amycolatopsis oliviviridis]